MPQLEEIAPFPHFGNLSDVMGIETAGVVSAVDAVGDFIRGKIGQEAGKDRLRLLVVGKADQPFQLLRGQNRQRLGDKQPALVGDALDNRPGGGNFGGTVTGALIVHGPHSFGWGVF